MDILKQVVTCEKTHPRSLFLNDGRTLNNTLIQDTSCTSCNALDYCSDFLKNRYTYKQSLIECLVNKKPYTGVHICDWCGFVIKPKNDKNYFCRGCGRTIQLDMIEQRCTKEVYHYQTPPTVVEQVKTVKPRICPNLMIAEKEPRTTSKIKSSSGLMLEQYEKIKSILTSPLTYNEIVEAVPELKSYKKPLNSLWSIIHRCNDGEIEATTERPVRLRLKCQTT